jgi:hypothetical protein
MSDNSAVPDRSNSSDEARKAGQINPEERKLLATAAAILAVGAAIVQIAGTNGESPARSITLAALTVAVGVPLLVCASRLAHARHKQIRVSILLAAGLVTAAGLTGGTAGYLIAHAGAPGQPTTGAPPRGSRSTGTTAAPSSSSPDPSPKPRPTPATGLHKEITDNENGTPVFGSAEGSAVNQDELIPFDRHVLVKCWAANKAGMTSINAFYLVETAPWSGTYAPANTFANGDPVGQPGSTTIDPAVPECH